MIPVEFRPITTWPDGQLRRDADRSFSRFKAGWSDTLDLLDRELGHLGAKAIVIEAAMKSRDIRADGWPRANARVPEHPGIIVSFDSKFGPLRYFTDEFKGNGNYGCLPGWQANVRAIGKSLEALRMVDRYGVTRRGEQYQGWSALPPAGGGTIAADPVMTLDDAIAYLHDAAPTDIDWDYDDPDGVTRAFRAAAKTMHPDAGGDPGKFRRLEQARRVILEASN